MCTFVKKSKHLSIRSVMPIKIVLVWCNYSYFGALLSLVWIPQLSTFCKRTIQSINYSVNEKYKDVQVEKEDKKKREVEGRVIKREDEA